MAVLTATQAPERDDETKIVSAATLVLPFLPISTSGDVDALLCTPGRAAGPAFRQ